jgi:hypothetical protein
MTTGLERRAHRLVELARAGDDPSAAQLLSLHGVVAGRIAAEGASAASGAAVSTKLASAGAFVKGLVVAGAMVTGAAGFFALQNVREPAVPLIAAARAARPPRPAVTAPVASAALEPAPAVGTSAPAVRQPSRPPNGSLRLQDEAALLAEVQGALRNGQASVALGKLESYDRRFPSGMLRSEADAARVFALCGAGKADKARAAAARFVQRYPNAPATARVQSACK